jgi:hypothetical protein
MSSPCDLHLRVIISTPRFTRRRMIAVRAVLRADGVALQRRHELKVGAVDTVLLQSLIARFKQSCSHRDNLYLYFYFLIM